MKREICQSETYLVSKHPKDVCWCWRRDSPRCHWSPSTRVAACCLCSPKTNKTMRRWIPSTKSPRCRWCPWIWCARTISRYYNGRSFRAPNRHLLRNKVQTKDQSRFLRSTGRCCKRPNQCWNSKAERFDCRSNHGATYSCRRRWSSLVGRPRSRRKKYDTRVSSQSRKRRRCWAFRLWLYRQMLLIICAIAGHCEGRAIPGVCCQLNAVVGGLNPFVILQFHVSNSSRSVLIKEMRHVVLIRSAQLQLCQPSSIDGPRCCPRSLFQSAIIASAKSNPCPTLIRGLDGAGLTAVLSPRLW